MFVFIKVAMVMLSLTAVESLRQKSSSITLHSIHVKSLSFNLELMDSQLSFLAHKPKNFSYLLSHTTLRLRRTRGYPTLYLGAGTKT